MFKNPESSIDILTSIEVKQIVRGAAPAQLSPEASSPSSSSDFLPSNFGRVATTVKASVFLSLPNPTSKALLDKIHDEDDRAISDVFKMPMQVNDSDHIPEVMRSPPVFRVAMQYRHEGVGYRFQGWAERAIAPDGKIDWSKSPLFELAWNDKMLVGITDMSGAQVAVDPKVDPTNQSYSFLDPLSDTGAKFKWRTREISIQSLFNEDEGPNQFTLDPKGARLRGLVRPAALIIEQKHSDFMAIQETPTVTLDSCGKRLREEALQTARVALKAKKRPTMQLAIRYLEPNP